MWKTVIAILCAIGTVLAQYSPQSVQVPEIPTFRNRTTNSRSKLMMRRYECPEGFVRLKRDCFYFSAGLANWQEAHFHCRDRHSTLATLTRKGMNKKLRNYLMLPHLRPFERWIGAKFNWPEMKWTWGVTGEAISYNGFGNLKFKNQDTYKWHCAVINPRRNYRWSPRECIKEMPYICHTRVGRIGKGRKRPPGHAGRQRKHRGGKERKQRIRPQSNGNETLAENSIEGNEVLITERRRPGRTPKRSYPMSGNGMKTGVETPSRTRWAPGAEASDRLYPIQPKGNKEPEQWVSAPVKAAILAKNSLDSPSKETSTESPLRPESKPKDLAAEPKETFIQFPLSNFFDEEVLLKN